MKVRKLLSKPESWVKGWLAMDKEDKPSLSDDACTTKWCLLGAVFRCYQGHKRHTVQRKLTALLNEDITSWNDKPLRTHKEVLELCKKLDI